MAVPLLPWPSQTGAHLLATGSAMICPRCEQLRYKSDWKPSQWKHCSAVTDYFNCCKACSDENFILMPRADLTAVCGAAARAVRDEWCFPPDFCNDLRGVVTAWMDQLNRTTRKELSYHGALRRRFEDDPKGWSNERTLAAGDMLAHKSLSIEYYFDPTNRIYQFAFRLVLEQLWQERQWNAETTGDIIEAMIGLPVAYPTVCQSAVCVANWWERYCYAVYRFCRTSQWRHVWDAYPNFELWRGMLYSCMPLPLEVD